MKSEAKKEGIDGRFFSQFQAFLAGAWMMNFLDLKKEKEKEKHKGMRNRSTFALVYEFLPLISRQHYGSLTLPLRARCKLGMQDLYSFEA